MTANNNIIDLLRPYLPLLIPMIVIQLGLMVAAVIDWIRRPKTRGPKWMWLVIILVVNLIGPLAYFVFGREEE